MISKNGANLRSKGEAHLYVAVAKADGLISVQEKIQASYHAQKSQDIFNVMKVNDAIKKTIKNDISQILNSPSFSSWNADRHLDEAISLLKKAKDAGEWSVHLTAKKSEDGLLKLALLDGYIIKESRFLKKVSEKLAILKD